MIRHLKTLFLIISISTCSFAQEAKNQIDFSEQEQQQRAAQEAAYKFSVDYRLQVGYLQEWQHSKTTTYPDLYLHGTKLGVTFDFNLPYSFTIQTGLLYTLTYGSTTQHWRNVQTNDYDIQTIKHRILSHQFNIPLFATANIKLWRKLSLIFYTGPELNIGLAQTDYMKTNLNEKTKNWLIDNNIHTEKYDRYTDGELIRTDIGYSLGAGIQWDRYRLQGGYTFGLNNLKKEQQKYVDQHMWNWKWNVSFSYRF